MPGHAQEGDGPQATQSRQDFPRFLFSATLLQAGLRAVLVVFIAVTLLCEPPNANLAACAAVLTAHVVIVGCWSSRALRPATRAVAVTRTPVTLVVLAADVTAVSVISVLTGLTAPDDWTSDVMRNAFFLIPLIAAAQLDPLVSAVVAIPTLAAFVATCWITQASNLEPWASIMLSTTVLAGLAGGSVAISLIQRSRVETIADLAQQRTQLLHDLLGVEQHERQSISERLHDGALQYVLVARQDVDEVRDGSVAAVERVDGALVECAQLLRDVVRELHPDVLVRIGLKAALAALTDTVTARTALAVDFDARTWPDDERTDADYVLYSAARETLTNVIKHAHAQHVWIDLERHDGVASLRVADDGVGTSEATVSRKAEEGHIGLASIRAKALASGGAFDMRSTSPGTEITITMPLDGPTIDPVSASTRFAMQGTGHA
jgi:two-component system NarL family sensor kinase